MGNIELGARLQEARKKKNLNQEKACEALDISTTATLSAYERGINNPPIEVLIKCSEVYQVSIDWIVTGKEYSENTHKTTSDFIFNLFQAVEHLGLEIRRTARSLDDLEEADDPFTMRTIFSIDLVQDRLRGFEDFVAELIKIRDARSVLASIKVDYEDVVRNRIREFSEKTNDFEEIPFE